MQPPQADSAEPTAAPVRPSPRWWRRKSLFRGVSWCARSCRWVVHVSDGGPRRKVGYFSDEIEAARAYDEAARQALGEWAMPNFPTEEESAFAARWHDFKTAQRFLGVTPTVWKRLANEGRITGGRLVPAPIGTTRRVFAYEELVRSFTQVFGNDRQCLARAVLRAGITPPPQQSDGQQQACLADWNDPRQAETTKMAA